MLSLPVFPQHHLLVVDDDTRLRQLLQKYLTEHGFLVTLAANASDARRVMEQIQFDLVIVDVMMPEENGLDFLRRLRKGRQSHLPVLMLSALGEPKQRIEGFEAGSDDYLPKPFEPRELLLRIRNLLGRLRNPLPREEKTASADECRFGPYRFDRYRQTLEKEGVSVLLSPLEQKIMHSFSERPGVLLDRSTLARLCGGEGHARAIDVAVARLRGKLSDDAKSPRWIFTIRGQGYVFRPD